MEASTTSAAIIAGGRALRFSGQDKSRLVVEGRTIIVRQVEVLQRVAAEVFIVGPDPERYRDIGVPVCPDVIGGAGALGGIHAALVHARHETVLAIGCDLPFLTAELLTRLIALSTAHDGAWVQSHAGVEPLVACYRRQAEPKIRARLVAGQFRASDLAATLDLAVLGPDGLSAFGDPQRLLTNVNTPDDYARVQYGAS